MASPRENPSRKGKYRCRMSGCTEIFDEKYKKNLHVAFAHTEQSPARGPGNNTNESTNDTPASNTNGITNMNTNGNRNSNTNGNGNVNANLTFMNQWQAVNKQPKSNGWQAVNMPPRQSPVVATPTPTTANIIKPFQSMNMQPKQYQSPYATQPPPLPPPPPPPTPPPPLAEPLPRSQFQRQAQYQAQAQAQAQAQPPLRIQTQPPVRTTYQSPYAPMPSPLQSLHTKASKSPSLEKPTQEKQRTPSPPPAEEPLTPLISPQHLPTHPTSPLSWGGSQLSPLSPTASISSSDTIELLESTMLTNYDSRKYGPGDRKSGFRCMACNLNFEERSELGLHTAFVHRGVRKLMIGTSPWGTWDVELRDEGGVLPVVRSDEGEGVRWGDVWGVR